MKIRSTHIAANVPSHHPRGYDDDQLGYRDYADAIIGQILALKAENSGISLGIFGDWGIGKSSMLQMIKSQIKKTNRFLIVEFDAWRYLRQEQLWLAFLRKIIAEIEEDEENNFWDVFKINMTLYWNRFQKTPNFVSKAIRLLIGIPTILLLILLLVTILFITIKNHSQIIAWLILGGSGVALFSTLLIKSIEFTSSAVKKISAHLPDIVQAGFDQDQSIPIDTFLNDFHTIVKEAGKKKTILVLVDDLDRCPPNQVVPVLEAIKHFGCDSLKAEVDKPLILFILAIDRDAIEQSVRGYFKDYFQNLREGEQKDFEISLFAREYVEKIIQIHFELPPLPPTQLNRLLHKNLEEFRKNNPDVKKETIKKIKEILSLNPTSQPRAVLQAYSAFLNRWEIITKRGIENRIDPSTLVVLLVIQYVWPDVFERICAYPQHFFYLHALTTGIDNLYCSITEIDECRELGFAVDEEENRFSIFRHNKFARLIGNVDIALWGSNTINVLHSLLFLSADENLHQAQPEQIWEVLQSGDPVRIKCILSDPDEESEVRKIFRRYTINYMAELSEQIKPQQESRPSFDVEAAEKALVVAGIIGDQQIVPIIFEIIQSGSLPTRLQIRAVYAIGHYAIENDKIAIAALMKIVRSEVDIHQAARIRAAYLLRYCDLSDDNINLVLDELRQPNQV